MGKYWLAVLAFLALAIPAQAQIYFVPMGPSQPPIPRTEPGNYDKIRTVAVLSAVGQTLTLERRQALLPQVKKIDISAWGLDDAIVALVKRYVGERFQIKDIAYDRTAIAQIPDGLWDHRNPALRNKFQPQKARSILNTLPKEGVDAFIIVRPALELGEGERGLTLISGSDLLGVGRQDQPEEWTNFKIDIVNPRTLTRIANAYARLQTRKGAMVTWTGVYTDQRLALDQSMSPTEEQLARLRFDFSRLLASSLVETLRSLELGITLPEVGERAIERRSMEKDPFADIKSVGLISVVGDELQLRHLGGTILSQSDESVPIPDWQIDAQVERIAHKLLAKRFEVKDVEFDRSALAKARLLDDEGKWVSAVPALKPSQDVDAYVVVMKHPLSLGRSRFDGAGIGVWNHNLAFNEETAVFANYAIAFVDARSLDLILGLVGTMDTSFPIRRPYQLVGNDLWPLGSMPLPADKSAKIRDTLTDLLENSVPETLLRMQLTDSVIAGGLPTPP